METSQMVVQEDTTSMGQTNIGRVCSTSQSTTSEILEPIARPTSGSNRRVCSTVAQEGSVPPSTVEINSESPTNPADTESERSDYGDSFLDNPILVSISDEDGDGKTLAASDQQIHHLGRVEVITRAQEAAGLPEETIKFLRGKLRERTTEIYNAGWRSYVTWACSNNPPTDPLKYDIHVLFKFFMAHAQHSLQHLRTIRAAIQSVFNEVHPAMQPIAQNRRIASFFTAKRKSTIVIPKPHQLEAWDIDHIVKFIGDTMNKNEELPLDVLQRKTIALISIATMWRPRSDIGRLQFRDVHCSRDEQDEVTGVTLFIRFPKEGQTKFSRFGTIEKQHLCPVRTLLAFTERTRTLREGFDPSHTLFLSHIMDTSRCRSVRPPTVANFIKQVMAEAGIDTTKYTPHSFRSAVSTKAVSRGISIQDVKIHANWSLNSTTFETYYLKPLNRESTGARIVTNIFS
jgi:integrase